MNQPSDSRSTVEDEDRNVFEAASDRLMIYDIGLDAVAEANPAACEMHGYTRQEFIGLSPGAFILPESDDRFPKYPRCSPSTQVWDDGRGFDTAPQMPSIHYGPSMMRERAEAVGAVLTITSQVDRATEIPIRWSGSPKQENG